jgi:hypothetical protein
MTIARRITALRRQLAALFILAVAMFCVPASAKAQVRDSSATRQVAPRAERAATPRRRDALLEIPRLVLDSLGLDVSDLHADLSLDAGTMNLVNLTAGLTLTTSSVRLGMHGIYAETYFYSSLDNATRIINRVMQSLKQNPALYDQLMGSSDSSAARRP